MLLQENRKNKNQTTRENNPYMESRTNIDPQTTSENNPYIKITLLHENNDIHREI